MKTYQRNAWYVAGFADEFAPGKLVARTLLDEKLVLFRTSEGGIAALADRCPHRFAPLSAGKVCDGGRSVECAYHGLRFGADGACVHNPRETVASRRRPLCRRAWRASATDWCGCGPATRRVPTSR